MKIEIALRKATSSVIFGITAISRIFVISAPPPLMRKFKSATFEMEPGRESKASPYRRQQIKTVEGDTYPRRLKWKKFLKGEKMSKKTLFMVSLLLILSSISILAQQSIKIKPILGNHSYTLESTDVGYGVTKHTLCLERLNGNATELYLPSDIILDVEGCPYSPPSQSGKLKINSQKTADGFLFVANGPQGNNFHLHFKKSASDNSSYSIEINLTQGNKYEFSIGYLPGGYLIIKGQSGDYYEMLDAVSSNNYYLEALSLLDDEFSKYCGDDQLEWWAQAVIALFQDLVDVEAIGSITYAQTASYSTEFFEGASSEYYSFLPIYWFSGGQGYIQILFPTQFLLLRVSERATVALYTTAGSYLYCKYNKCEIFQAPPSRICA